MQKSGKERGKLREKFKEERSEWRLRKIPVNPIKLEVSQNETNNQIDHESIGGRKWSVEVVSPMSPKEMIPYD